VSILRSLGMLLGALLFASPALHAESTSSDQTVTCKDGTTAKKGKGACSHHGGVAKPAESGTSKETKDSGKASSSSSSKSSSTKSSSSKSSSSQKAGSSTGSGGDQPAGSANSNPAGATARCKDGTYSHSKSHSGTCSKHGGVAEWLDKK
jgi:hypothetical protein